MKPITDTPDEVRRIADNTDAKLFLTQLGLLDKLLELAVRPEGVSPSKPWGSRLYLSNHITHWIIADYYCGYANPADNGFLITCIPKSQCSPDEFRALQERSQATEFSEGITSSWTGKYRPPQN
jgi:hypothetical protein